jgi:peptidyl-prolyl cis-trans isomerase A (cyclophilin A)
LATEVLVARSTAFLLPLLGCLLCAACAPKKTDTPAKETAPGAKASEKAPAKKGPDFGAVLRAPKLATHQAPDTFTVKLETTAGDISMDVTRAWSPKGADRFYTLVRAGYYTDIAFFRVIPGFMAQVGISGDPSLNTLWHRTGIADEPITPGVSNTRGMVTYAKGGPNTRSTQFFINFGNNGQLDAMGFPPFAKVQDTSMGVVAKIYSGYGECAPRGRGPEQGRLQREGTPYLKRDFPELTYIKTASVVSAP